MKVYEVWICKGRTDTHSSVVLHLLLSRCLCVYTCACLHVHIIALSLQLYTQSMSFKRNLRRDLSSPGNYTH